MADAALALGCDVVVDRSIRAIAALRPDVVVIDDPIASHAARWVAHARRLGCLVVSIHDLGLGCRDADIVVDGSVTRPAVGSRGATLAGPRFAVLDPSFSSRSNARRAGRAGTRVLISLGGGPRTRMASAIAAAISSAEPDADVRVVGGFISKFADARRERITWIGAPLGLGDELSRADVAVIGGGVSLYEAAALGVPTVAVPVVRAQEPTVAAFTRRRAALGTPSIDTAPRVIAMQAARLLRDGRLRHQISRTARTVVDGRGSARVAAAIAVFARRHER
jgi:spore coat polysaccharide biosynthesis predicted glycosyltransferase SpsG